MHHHTDRITHTTAFVTPVMEHWLEREIAQWVLHEGSKEIKKERERVISVLEIFLCIGGSGGGGGGEGCM